MKHILFICICRFYYISTISSWLLHRRIYRYFHSRILYKRLAPDVHCRVIGILLPCISNRCRKFCWPSYIGEFRILSYIICGLRTSVMNSHCNDRCRSSVRYNYQDTWAWFGNFSKDNALLGIKV
jgi:hypothetical protein